MEPIEFENLIIWKLLALRFVYFVYEVSLHKEIVVFCKGVQEQECDVYLSIIWKELFICELFRYWFSFSIRRN